MASLALRLQLREARAALAQAYLAAARLLPGVCTGSAASEKKINPRLHPEALKHL